MAFGKSTQKREQSEGGTSEPIYLKLGEGRRVIRVLDKEETEFWRFWLPVTINGKKSAATGRGVTIGNMRESPIAKYMNEIGEDHPDFRKIQRRLLINVLDRTPVRRNENGAVEYADSNGKFTAGNVTPQPHNRVLVLEFGAELMNQFMMIHEYERDPQTFEPLAIWDLDVNIVSRGTGKDVKRMVLPDRSSIGPLSTIEGVDVANLRKYDLSTMVRPMPVEAQQRLLDGEEYTEVLKDLGWDRPVPTLPLDA